MLINVLTTVRMFCCYYWICIHFPVFGWLVQRQTSDDVQTPDSIIITDHIGVAVYQSVGRVIEITVRQTRLVLRLVTAPRYTVLVSNHGYSLVSTYCCRFAHFCNRATCCITRILIDKAGCSVINWPSTVASIVNLVWPTTAHFIALSVHLCRVQFTTRSDDRRDMPKFSRV